ASWTWQTHNSPWLRSATMRTRVSSPSALNRSDTGCTCKAAEGRSAGITACRYPHVLMPSRLSPRGAARQGRLGVSDLYDEDFPSVAVRVLDPDLVLEGVAAVGAMLLVVRQTRGAQPSVAASTAAVEETWMPRWERAPGVGAGPSFSVRLRGWLGHVELRVAWLELYRFDAEEGPI